MKAISFLIVCTFVIVFTGCKKETTKDYNVLKITQGEFNGYTYTYQTYGGFWADVDQSTKYIHLVFGADTNNPVIAPGVMDILFYYKGTNDIYFQSPEGQWIQIALNINSSDYYFRESDANIIINQISDTEIDGHLAGSFVDQNDANRTISLEMDFKMALKKL